MKLTTYLTAVVFTFSFVGCSGDDSATDAGTPNDAAIAPDTGTSTDAGIETDAAGGDGDSGVDTMMMEDLFPDGLECPTFSMCSTYEADPSRVPFPDPGTPGGTLRDGLYRPVQGTTLAYVLAIHDGKWARIMPNLTVQYGDIMMTSENTYETVRHTTCANGTLNEDAFVLEEDYFFAASGDELITYVGCGSAIPTECNSPVRLIRVSSLCEDLDSLQCEDGDCNCVAFSGEIPARPDNDTCDF